MNRLTKEIGLVLISSSLTLHGCYGRPQPTGYEFAKERDQRPAEQGNSSEDFGGGGDFGGDTSSPSTSDASRGSHYHAPIHRGGHVPLFVPLPLGGRSRTSSPGPATSSGFRAGPATSAGARSTTSSRAGGSSIGGSARGGFGSTGHGVSS